MVLAAVVVTETVPPNAALPPLLEPQNSAEQLPDDPPAPPRLTALIPFESVPAVVMVPWMSTETVPACPPAPPEPPDPPALISALPPLPPLPPTLAATTPADDGPVAEIAP